MSNAFKLNGNTISLTAATTAVQANIHASGTNQIGSFMIDNVGNVPAFVAWGYANTTTATIANATTSSTSFTVLPNQTKWLATNIAYAQAPANTVYFSGITSSGSAQLMITPVAIQP
jgi:hypothetical protein